MPRPSSVSVSPFGNEPRLTTARTFKQGVLGGALLGQAQQLQATDAAAATAKFTEAEPLLVQGYEGMQQREAAIPPEGKIRLNEALQRLVDLYTAWGKPDEAAKWQVKLDCAEGRGETREQGELNSIEVGRNPLRVNGRTTTRNKNGRRAPRPSQLAGLSLTPAARSARGGSRSFHLTADRV